MFAIARSISIDLKAIGELHRTREPARVLGRRHGPELLTELSLFWTFAGRPIQVMSLEPTRSPSLTALSEADENARRTVSQSQLGAYSQTVIRP